MTKLIDKNTTIPANAEQVFSTADDNQSAVTIHVLQGERERGVDNKSLGRFDLADIPPAPRGLPQIEVTFDIDANGILNVSAKDKATGKEQQIRIQASGGLSDEDIERMVSEAEAHADDDKAKREMVEVRNSADALVHSSEKNLQEYGDKVPEEDKEAIETAIQELKDALEPEDADVETIKSKTEALTEASMKLGEAMYKAQQAEGGEAGEAGPDGGADAQAADDNVVDADFEEVNPDDDKK